MPHTSKTVETTRFATIPRRGRTHRSPATNTATINLEEAVEPRRPLSSRRKTKYSNKPLAHPPGELRYLIKQLILFVFFVPFVVK